MLLAAAQEALGAVVEDTELLPTSSWRETLTSVMQLAASVGEQVDKVQIVATTVVQIRQATLKAFKEEHVEISIVQLAKRVRDEIDRGTKSAMFDGAWKVLAEVSSELLEEFANLIVPSSRIRKILTTLQKLFQLTSPKTAPGATDVMQGLLPLLTKQQLLLGHLDKI